MVSFIPKAISGISAMFLPGSTSSLSRLPLFSTFKDPCDYVGLIWIRMDNLHDLSPVGKQGSDIIQLKKGVTLVAIVIAVEVAGRGWRVRRDSGGKNRYRETHFKPWLWGTQLQGSEPRLESGAPAPLLYFSFSTRLVTLSRLQQVPWLLALQGKYLLNFPFTLNLR